jgi:hypothetical protein
MTNCFSTLFSFLCLIFFKNAREDLAFSKEGLRLGERRRRRRRRRRRKGEGGGGGDIE